MAKGDETTVKTTSTTTSTGKVGGTNDDDAVLAPKEASANSILTTDGEAKPTTQRETAAGR